MGHRAISISVGPKFKPQGAVTPNGHDWREIEETNRWHDRLQPAGKEWRRFELCKSGMAILQACAFYLGG